MPGTKYPDILVTVDIRIDNLNVYYGSPQNSPPADETTIGDIKEDIDAMNQKLTDEIAALTATASEEQTELASIKAYVTGVPDVVAAAVSAALSAHDIDEATAADTIEAARATVAGSVTDVITAISANTAPAPVEEPSATQEGGAA